MSGEKDANDPQSKNYMWVYHSPGIQDSKKIYLYEYDNGSRSAAVIDRYLEGYKGILVSDGYASYHTLDRKHDDLKVAGCWVHCKRKYAEIVKNSKKRSCIIPGTADRQRGCGKNRRYFPYGQSQQGQIVTGDS